eukprot:8735218-Alexandrium_andersonii.AAC.1
MTAGWCGGTGPLARMGLSRAPRPLATDVRGVPPRGPSEPQEVTEAEELGNDGGTNARARPDAASPG